MRRQAVAPRADRGRRRGRTRHRRGRLRRADLDRRRCNCQPAGEASHPAGSAHRRLSGLPRRQRVEPADRVSCRCIRSAHRSSHIQASARQPAPRLRREPDYGIPFVVVPGDSAAGADHATTRTATRAIPGPFPIPLDAPIEGGGGGGDATCWCCSSRHVSCSSCSSAPHDRRGWVAASGAKFDLHHERAASDSAGRAPTPPACRSCPGLVRYDEVAAGRHRPRHPRHVLADPDAATSSRPRTSPPTTPTRRCRRWACGCGCSADFDVAALTGQARVIATAMQRYGLIVADNGSNWFFQGAPNPGWNDDDLNQLKSIPGPRSRSSTPARFTRR